MLYSAIILFSLALLKLQAAARPPAKFQLIGSRLFYIEKNTTVDWFEATRTCRRMNGVLATIRNQQELDLIVPKLEWDSKYWLFVNDLTQEGTFDSISFNPPFLNWRQGQPDNYNSNEDCVMIINNYMYDSVCDSKALFICERWDVTKRKEEESSSDELLIFNRTYVKGDF
ncbi:C-type lectin 37Db-like [Drosophila kikkawai]|uniref:C-type lectin 37Db-like n=1 Tax=Drosophila kikkawai TaxID=30033 RepID=A0ABM4GFJ7_DROKI